MFRITTICDDRHSPMNGVCTVASIEEALAAMPDAEAESESVEWELNEILDYGGRVTLYGDDCEYIVERLA